MAALTRPELIGYRIPPSEIPAEAFSFLPSVTRIDSEVGSCRGV